MTKASWNDVQVTSSVYRVGPRKWPRGLDWLRCAIWCFLNDQDTTEPWKQWKAVPAQFGGIFISRGVMDDWRAMEEEERRAEIVAWAAPIRARCNDA